MTKTLIVSTLTVLLFATVSSTVYADYLYDRSGTLTIFDGYVLGEESEVVPTETEKKKREQTRLELERQVSARQKAKEVSGTESRLEIKNTQIKQTTRDRVGATTEKVMELKRDESVHIEDRDGRRTEIRPTTTEQKLEIVKERTKAKTNLDLVVNENNELMITRPDGTTKTVTVLPDEAVAKMQARGILVDDINEPELTENEDGQLVYSVPEVVERRVLGFALQFRRQTEVSAETGEINTVSRETNPVKRWLERFAFGSEE